MYRKPEHYPKWLRGTLYNPLYNMRSVYPNTERNIDTMYKIMNGSYSSDPIHALLFDMSIELERNEIKHQEYRESVKSSFIELNKRITKLEKRLGIKKVNKL